jgi:hypothetical protein
MGKEHSMTTYNDAMCDDLRAWMSSPAIGLPEYSADPVVQRRVGRILASLTAKAPTAARNPKVHASP